MARTTLNKSALQREREKLDLYRRLLPSLDLKRRQLTLELGRAGQKLEAGRQALAALLEQTASELPMLAGEDRDLSGRVRLASARVEEENLVGVKLPVLREIRWEAVDYSLLAEPPWVDVLVESIQRAGEQKKRVEVLQERVARLTRANRRITQRINLFQEILIPQAEKNLRRIRIVLGDAEMSAVVRSKIAKALHERKRTRR